MAAVDTSMVDTIAKTVQVVSVVAGVVISVLSFNAAREKDSLARRDEAEKRLVEAARPFLELRQARYTEAIHAAGVLVNPKNHTTEEIEKAQKRFWELYWAELSMVEAPEVEGAMKRLGDTLRPNSVPTPEQDAAYTLAHALRNSLVQSWGVTKEKVGQLNP
jgi:hypothetical protein